MQPLNIGLIGCGNVGGGLVELVERHRERVERRTGLSPRISKVLVRDRAKARRVDPALVTTDPDEFFGGDGVVVELIGGVEPARSYVLRALESRRNVVTANKALLAACGDEIFRRAHDSGVSVGFEASVCGAIPIVRVLGSGLIANRIESLVGIVNGTCNFVLTQMTERGLAREEAIEEARKRGLTEADPSLDLSGVDAAQKLLILTQLAFGERPSEADVHVRGIEDLDREDIASAAEFGYVIRHVVQAPELRVEPVFLPPSHPLAGVRDEYNAVVVRGDAAGEMIFTGKGAGPLPTAGAVLSDILDVAARPACGFLAEHRPATRVETASPFYLRFPILDRPGVIGLISTALGNHGVSISRASATLTSTPGRGNVKLLVHGTSTSRLDRAVAEIGRLPVLAGRPVVIRIL